MIITVSGSPGTGKTTLASRLSRRYELRYINVGEIVLENGAWLEYDPVHRSFVIDPPRVARHLSSVIRGTPKCVIETMDLQLLVEAGVEPIVVVVLRAHPRVLYERLVAKNWPIEKIVENLEAELLGVIYAEALNFFEGRVCSIDTTHRKPDEVEAIVSRVIERVAYGKRINSIDVCQAVDWLTDPFATDLVASLASRAGM